MTHDRPEDVVAHDLLRLDQLVAHVQHPVDPEQADVPERGQAGAPDQAAGRPAVAGAGLEGAALQPLQGGLPDRGQFQGGGQGGDADQLIGALARQGDLDASGDEDLEDDAEGDLRSLRALELDLDHHISGILLLLRGLLLLRSLMRELLSSLLRELLSSLLRDLRGLS